MFILHRCVHTGLSQRIGVHSRVVETTWSTSDDSVWGIVFGVSINDNSLNCASWILRIHDSDTAIAAVD